MQRGPDKKGTRAVCGPRAISCPSLLYTYIAERAQKSIGEIVVVVVGICLKTKIPVLVFAHAHTHAHIHYIDVVVHERFPSGAAAHAAPVAILGYFIKGFSFIIIIFSLVTLRGETAAYMHTNKKKGRKGLLADIRQRPKSPGSHGPSTTAVPKCI